MQLWLAYAAAICSAIFNGSFTSLYKFDAVAALDLHPVVFTFYVATGVFLSSVLFITLILLYEYMADVSIIENAATFTIYGVICGLLLDVALICSFLAIDNIGVALSQGVFGGTAILVSYLWGTIIFNQTPKIMSISILGLLLLLLGVLGIAFNDIIERILTRFLNRQNSYDSLQIHEDNRDTNGKTHLKGLGWAFLVGLSGGSILAPAHFAPESAAGVGLLPSFGIGALIGAVLFFPLKFGFHVTEYPEMFWKEASLAGLTSGLLWNVSNVLAMVAIPVLGYGVAYPILQCALFVAGVWGIFVFGEIEGKQIFTFFMSGVVLIVGAVCLAYAAA